MAYIITEMENENENENENETITKQVKQEFYRDYISNQTFKSKFKERYLYIKRNMYIKRKYELKLPVEEIIKEYFVEIFSYIVIPYDILLIIADYLKTMDIKYVIDPCCGNAFHTFLFNEFTDFITTSIDNQKEPNSWLEVIEQDGVEYIKNMNELEHQRGALILSYIKEDKLACELLNSYEGRIIISIGNYDNLTHSCPNYLSGLNRDYDLQKRIILKMPWGLEEKIEIYLRKSI